MTAQDPITTETKWCNAGQHRVIVAQFSKNSAKADGLQVRCKSCQKKYYDSHLDRIRERGREWRSENSEIIRAKKKEVYWRDPELSRAQKMAWHHANREANLERRKADYDARPEHYRAQRRKWRANNPEASKECDRRKYHRIRKTEKFKIDSRRQGKIYYSRHPDKVKAKAHRRRSAQGAFTSEQWIEKCAYHGWRCYLCLAELTLKTATVDHRKSLIRGGLNWIANIAPACRYCNAAKASYSEHEYRKRIADGLTKINPQSVIKLAVLSQG